MRNGTKAAYMVAFAYVVAAWVFAFLAADRVVMDDAMGAIPYIFGYLSCSVCCSLACAFAKNFDRWVANGELS